MGWIIIRNWQRYQHRDARCARVLPWIKEYTEQLHDDDYRGLTMAERGLLGGIRQLFAASDGRLTANTRDLTRALNAHVYGRQLKRLCDAGFIEIVDSKPARMSASAPAGKGASLEERREDIASSVTGSINGPVPVPVPSELATKDEEIDFAPPADVAPSGSGAGAGDLETLDYAASLSALAREEEA